MKVIGLTGGIASGKSTVSRMLKELGAEIIDADIIAREIVKPGQKTLDAIVKQFGRGILNSDGSLNRKKLGEIVFNDYSKLKLINDITHPKIRKIIAERLEELRQYEACRIAVIDAAVLLESNMDDMVDEVWLVYVDYDTQLKRLIKRDNITEHEAKARIISQMPIEEKIKRSKRIIDNSKGLENTREQVERIWNDLMKSLGKST